MQNSHKAPPLSKAHKPQTCEESACHLLFECPALAHLRQEFSLPSKDDAYAWFSAKIGPFLVAALRVLSALGHHVPPWVNGPLPQDEGDPPPLKRRRTAGGGSRPGPSAPVQIREVEDPSSDERASPKSPSQGEGAMRQPTDEPQEEGNRINADVEHHNRCGVDRRKTMRSWV